MLSVSWRFCGVPSVTKKTIRNGVVAVGTVDKTEPTGTTHAGEVQVSFDVKVKDTAGHPITLSKTAYFPQGQLRRMHLGMQIARVTYLTHDHSQFHMSSPMD